MARVRLEGQTSSGRTETISAVKELIGRAGWLVGFVFFSSKAAVFTFEIEAARLGPLANDLVRAGIVMRPGTIRTIAEAGLSQGTMEVTLHLLFMHEGTDMRMEVPPIPG